VAVCFGVARLAFAAWAAIQCRLGVSEVKLRENGSVLAGRRGLALVALLLLLPVSRSS
jgi:hypothetical protein